MQQEKNYMPIRDEDHDRIIKGQTDGLSLEMAIYNAGYERGKAQHPSGCEWVKASANPETRETYYWCKLISKRGIEIRGAILFSNNGKWATTDYEVIEWLSESPSKEGIKLPNDVVEKLLKVRDYIAIGEYDEAYHHLYSIAAPKFDSYFPWKELEEQVGYVMPNEKQLIEKKEGNKEREMAFAEWVCSHGYWPINKGLWNHAVNKTKTTAELWNEWNNQQKHNQ